jgi:hypothetical protein
MINFIRKINEARIRYGPGAALLLASQRVLLKLLRLRVSRISISPNTEYHAAVSGYPMARLDRHNFNDYEFPTLSRYTDAVERGDVCIVTLYHDEIVGFNLYSLEPTRVYRHLEFYFPPDWRYSYGDFTLEAHRGKQLSPARWSFHQNLQHSAGLLLPTVAITDLYNLPAWYRRSVAGEQIIGYTLAFEWGHMAWALRSRGCRLAHCGIKRIQRASAHKFNPE